MRKLFLSGLVISAVLIFSVSCDKKRVFEDYFKIKSRGWDKDSVKTFSFQVLDSVAFHNIYINLRNKTNYNFSNIWLFIRIQSPEKEFLTDTVQFILADPSGKWLGKGFSGILDNQFPYMNNVYFPRKGTYQVSIQHGMRPGLLGGISDIGLRIEKR